MVPTYRANLMSTSLLILSQDTRVSSFFSVLEINLLFGRKIKKTELFFKKGPDLALCQH